MKKINSQKKNISIVLSPRHQIRPIFIGDDNVGKTSIISKYTNSTYINDTKIEFYNKIIDIDNQDINLIIWDIKGHTFFNNITNSYIKDGNEFIKRIKEYNNKLPMYEYYPILLIGNKRDLISDRKVTYEEAEKYAIFHKLLYIELSIYDNIDRLNTSLQLYFTKIYNISSNEHFIEENLNYSKIFNNFNMYNDNQNKKKISNSKSIDNIELLDEKYKPNKYYYECKKYISNCIIL